MTYIPKGWYDEEIARLHRIIEARECMIESRDRRCDELEADNTQLRATLREILAEVGACIDRRPSWSSPSKSLPPDPQETQH
jgi:hypothetical protein